MRTSKLTILIVGTVIFLAAIAGLVTNHLDAWKLPTVERTKAKANNHRPPPSQHVPLLAPLPTNTTSELAQLFMEQIMRPSVRPDSPSYSPYGAFGWGLPEVRKWTEPLGEKFCIIDLDNRPFTEPGQLFSPDGMSWDRPQEVHGLSIGVLNHWLYARIHGYKYYYIDIDEFEDRRTSWKKPPIISKILQNHDACVYIDSDAIFSRLDLPFEWLMNYWQIHPEDNSLALAFDPDQKHNQDKFGKIYLNTGFIVAQNNDKTYEIMDSWADCPNDKSAHPDCKNFRTNVPGQPTDQGGFGTYIRYDYPKDIKELPCNEANGFPQSGSGCNGDFIKHLWTGKHDWIKIAVGEQMPGALLDTFHKQFIAEKASWYLTEKELME
ncbi:hypothetical protein G7046_g3655 [Stylonectria norvegica]|nr:hypothetical protein G7046_g3655 [Stylonectria norvegica]